MDELYDYRKEGVPMTTHHPKERHYPMKNTTRAAIGLASLGIILSPLAGPAKDAHAADPLVGFAWVTPRGQVLTDQGGTIDDAELASQGLYKICFTIPNHATTAQYSVTTGENPPRLAEGDWSWTWADIEARIADGRFDEAKDFSYSFNESEVSNPDGQLIAGNLNECDIFKGERPGVIEGGDPHDGGTYTPPTPKPTPKPVKMATRTFQVDKAQLTGNTVINRYLKADDDRKLAFRELKGVWSQKGFKETHEFVTVKVPATATTGQVIKAVNAKSKVGDVRYVSTLGPTKASKLTVTYAWEVLPGSWKDSKGGQPQQLLARS